jgi:hypothetical protein
LRHWFAARSGWSIDTPVSTTAATTSLEPVVTAHASGASMSASAVPVSLSANWPVLSSPHCSPKRGSSGTPEATSVRIGSAQTTLGSRRSVASARERSPPTRR